jgi:hypothetical protein
MPEPHFAITLEDYEPLAHADGEAVIPIDTGEGPADEDKVVGS